MKTIFRTIKLFSLLLLTFLLLESCSNESKMAEDRRAAEVDENIVSPPSPEAGEEPAPEPVPEPEPIIVAPEGNGGKAVETDKPARPNGPKKPTGIKPNRTERAIMMPSFPFPPPKASASHTFEQNLFSKANNLYEVSELIEGALKKSGYYEKSYYKIPNGFALVTRMEKIESDGAPAPNEERWDVNHKSTGGGFDLMSYFKSLFVAKDGNYRIIVFLITPENMRQTEEVMTMEAAKEYLTKGYNRLPNDFKNIPFTDAYSCSALIYEWYKIEHEDPKFMSPSKFLGQYHLAKNKFVDYIKER